MQSDAFWQIIDRARAAGGNSIDGDEIAAQVSAVLAARSTDEILDFGVVLIRLLASSYRWDLWGGDSNRPDRPIGESYEFKNRAETCRRFPRLTLLYENQV